MPKWTLREKIARPEGDTPRRLYNMLLPTSFWVISIYVAVGVLNDPSSETATEDFMAAMIYCTIGVAAVTQIFYAFQRKLVTEDKPQDVVGERVESGLVSLSNIQKKEVDDGATSKSIVSKSEISDPPGEVDVHDEDDSVYLPIVSMSEGAQCFLKGGAAVTPVLMTLTLAWASTEVFLELGMDRLFADLVNQNDFKVESYPTIGFLVSFLLALSTGSSAAAQSIVLPLLTVPIYVESNGNAELFYALVGAVISGSVVGDHASPISASSILSSVAIECDLRAHILTQTPHIFFVAFLSVIVGHLPSASETFPVYASYILGLFLSIAFIYTMCEDIMHPEGKYDFMTERYFVRRSLYLQELQDAIFAEYEEHMQLETDVSSGSLSESKGASHVVGHDGDEELSHPQEVAQGLEGPSSSSTSVNSSRSESCQPRPRFQKIVVDKPRPKRQGQTDASLQY